MRSLLPALLLLAACDDRRYPLGSAPVEAGAPTAGQGGGAVMGTGGGPVGIDEGHLPRSTCSVPRVVTPEEPVALAPEVLARRLAAFLWNGEPDADLVGRAAVARTSAQVQALATAMTADPRWVGGVDALAREWLGLEKAEAYEGADEVKGMFDADLRASMVGETSLFIRDLFLSSDPRLPTLLLGSYSFVDERLAQLYGLAPVGSQGFVRVPLDQQQRAGILSQASVLFARPRISGRGTWVLNSLLCIGVPTPPAPGVDNLPVLRMPGQTERQVLEVGTANPGCQPCHAVIDPPGYAFGHYDALGRWSELDHGKPIDASGSLQFQTVSLKFDGVRQLGEQLVGSCDLYRCAVQAYLHRALGSPKAGSAETRAALLWAFVDSGLDLRALFSWVAASPSFLAP
jgi:hypothetical protein